MLLTKECDYAVRIIRILSDARKKTVKTICDTEYIPEKYAYKILKKLEHAGFVQSVRGRDGGYYLSKTLSSFTIYDIAHAVDNSIFVFECLQDKTFCPHKTSDTSCSAHLEFERIQNILINEMQSKTINEILNLPG